MTFEKMIQVEVPDCTAPYQTLPMWLASGAIVSVVAIIAIAILIGMWIDKK